MGQKETLSLLQEVGGFATAKELTEFAMSYYADVQLARDVGSNLHRLRRWESVKFDIATQIWSIVK